MESDALTAFIEDIGRIVDFVGIAITAGGGAASLAIYLWRFCTGHARDEAYRQCRQSLGRAILLGLEFLVAGDIIRTVAISPTFTSVGVLAVIVLIRTFLSATLTVEIEGRWPWQRGRVEGERAA
jgi:uncharacterized membrane protein